MSREEQIRKTAKECFFEESDGFIEGAKWADENPKVKWDFSLLLVQDKLTLAEAQLAIALEYIELQAEMKREALEVLDKIKEMGTK